MVPAPQHDRSANSAIISVAIVEDSEALRDSLSVLLNGTPGFKVCAVVGSAEQAIKRLPSIRPAVVLMDINLPNKSGIDCVLELKPLLPATRIMMLTVFSDPDHIFAALKAGASGYLSKRTAPAEILKAIQDLHSGGSPLSSEIAVRIVEYFQSQQTAAITPEANLSPRESEILQLLAKGYLYKEIAETLRIAYHTVHFHIRNIYDKLHVRSRTEAVAKFLRP